MGSGQAALLTNKNANSFENDMSNRREAINGVKVNNQGELVLSAKFKAYADKGDYSISQEYRPDCSTVIKVMAKDGRELKSFTLASTDAALKVKAEDQKYIQATAKAAAPVPKNDIFTNNPEVLALKRAGYQKDTIGRWTKIDPTGKKSPVIVGQKELNAKLAELGSTGKVHTAEFDISANNAAKIEADKTAAKAKIDDTAKAARDKEDAAEAKAQAKAESLMLAEHKRIVKNGVSVDKDGNLVLSDAYKKLADFNGYKISFAKQTKGSNEDVIISAQDGKEIGRFSHNKTLVIAPLNRAYLSLETSKVSSSTGTDIFIKTPSTNPATPTETAKPAVKAPDLKAQKKAKEEAEVKFAAEAKFKAESAHKLAVDAKKAYEARVNIDLKHGLTETELAFIKDLGYAHGKYFGYTKDGKKVDAKEIQAVVKLRRDTHQAAVAALPAANENNHKAAQAADAAKVAWLRAGDAVAKAATVKSSIEINPKVSQTVLNALETNDKELKTSITTAAAATQAAQKLDIALEYYKSIKDNSTIKDDQKKLAYDQTIKARDEATSKHAVAETALGISQKALKALTDAQQAYSDARNKRDKAIQEATTVYNQALKTHEETQKTYETTMTAAKAATEAVTKAEQATTDKAIDAATKIKLNERAVTPAKK